jgi:hypothetical protein
VYIKPPTISGHRPIGRKIHLTASTNRISLPSHSLLRSGAKHESKTGTMKRYRHKHSAASYSHVAAHQANTLIILRSCDRAAWHVTVHREKFLYNNQLDPLISQIYFGNETLRVSASSSVHRHELFTAHSTMVCVLQVYRQLSSSRIRIFLLESCLQTCRTHTIAECTVNNSWRWTEELSETCGVSFQNKFENLVHLVGFIARKSTFIILLCLY